MSPEDAKDLAFLAMFLIPLAWMLAKALKSRMSVLSEQPPQASNSSESLLFVVSHGWALSQIILIVHFMNIGFFLFAMSTWTPLGQWISHLLPDRANQGIMLMSYFIIAAIMKTTWSELTRILDWFQHPPEHGTGAPPQILPVQSERVEEHRPRQRLT